MVVINILPVVDSALNSDSDSLYCPSTEHQDAMKSEMQLRTPIEEKQLNGLNLKKKKHLRCD